MLATYTRNTIVLTDLFAPAVPEVDFGLRSSYAENSEQPISNTHMQPGLLIFNALTSPMAPPTSILDAMYYNKVLIPLASIGQGYRGCHGRSCDHH